MLAGSCSRLHSPLDPCLLLSAFMHRWLQYHAALHLWAPRNTIKQPLKALCRVQSTKWASVEICIFWACNNSYLVHLMGSSRNLGGRFIRHALHCSFAALCDNATAHGFSCQ